MCQRRRVALLSIVPVRQRCRVALVWVVLVRQRPRVAPFTLRKEVRVVANGFGNDKEVDEDATICA